MRAPLRILLAEDDPGARDSLAAFLYAEGHEVVEVANPLHAIETARTHGFDLAVIDLRLPPDGAFQLVAELFSAHPLCRIVFVDTPGVNDEVRRSFRDRVSVLNHPFRTETLKNYLDLQAERFHAERERAREAAHRLERFRALSPPLRLYAKVRPALVALHQSFLLYALLAGALAGLLIAHLVDHDRLPPPAAPGDQRVDGAALQELHRDIKHFLEDWKKKDLKQNEGNR